MRRHVEKAEVAAWTASVAVETLAASARKTVLCWAAEKTSILRAWEEIRAWPFIQRGIIWRPVCLQVVVGIVDTRARSEECNFTI